MYILPNRKITFNIPKCQIMFEIMLIGKRNISLEIIVSFVSNNSDMLSI